MSIRSFVALSSLLLLAWLAVAFVHQPLAHKDSELLADDAEEAQEQQVLEPEQLALSASR